MEELFKKGQEMAEDPAMQERLKNAAQEHFGKGSSHDADRNDGDAGERSHERHEASDDDLQDSGNGSERMHGTD